MDSNSLATPTDVKWQPADLNRWLNTAPPPLDYIFADMFPCGIVAGLGGGGGVGKSTFALQLAYSLAAGKVVFESFVPVKPAPVMVFLGEDPSRVTWHRFYHSAQGFPLEPEQIENLKKNLVIYSKKAAPLCVPVDGRLKPTKHYQWMKEQVQAVRPALLILDPKSRWFAGKENSNDDATAFVNLIEGLVRPYGGSVLLTHHVSKSQKDKLEVSSARGASAFADACRLFYGMVRCPLKGTNNIGARQEILLQTTKSNFTPLLPKPLVLRHSLEHGGIFEQVPYGESSQVVLVMTSLTEWLFENGSMNLSAIRDPRDERANQLHDFMEERCGSYRKYIDAAIEEGEEQGLLVVESVSTGGRKARRVRAADASADDNDIES